MNINRNVLKIVAGVLLVASLPAGAQVLGGSLGGAANGALGGGLGQGIHGSGGIMGGGSITGPDVTGAAGKVRERAQQAGERTQDAAGRQGHAARCGSRVEQTRRGSASGGTRRRPRLRTAAASRSRQRHCEWRRQSGDCEQTARWWRDVVRAKWRCGRVERCARP